MRSTWTSRSRSTPSCRRSPAPTGSTRRDKTHGLIVDYLGVFDDVAKAFKFDSHPSQQIITNIEELKAQLEPAIDAALAFFPGVDRTVGGYEGLIQAQTAIADDAKKDAFGLAYSVVSQLWEAISPDPMLSKFEDDYRWLTDVYESVRPSDITGRLVWHALGAKTLDLINEHVQVEVPAQAPETIVLDAQTIEDLLSGKRKDADPDEIEKQITARIARHLNNPVFVELGKRLNALREKYAGIQQSSLEFLHELWNWPATPSRPRRRRRETPRGAGQGRAHRTVRVAQERRHPGHRREHRQPDRRGGRRPSASRAGRTRSGRPGVRQALRKTLYVQFKIRDNDVFEKALGYVREYY